MISSIFVKTALEWTLVELRWTDLELEGHRDCIPTGAGWFLSRKLQQTSRLGNWRGKKRKKYICRRGKRPFCKSALITVVQHGAVQQHPIDHCEPREKTKEASQNPEVATWRTSVSWLQHAGSLVTNIWASSFPCSKRKVAGHLLTGFVECYGQAVVQGTALGLYWHVWHGVS